LFAGISKIKAGKYISLETTGTPANDSANVGIELLVTKLKPEYNSSGDIISYRIYIDESTPFIDELIAADKKVKVVLKDRFVHELAPEMSSTLSTYVSAPMHLANPSTGLRITMDCNVLSDTGLEVWYRALMYNEENKLADERWFKIEPLQRIITLNDFQTFTEVVWEENDLKAFDVCQTKVVFRSDNNALTPRMKNFRMMALA